MSDTNPAVDPPEQEKPAQEAAEQAGLTETETAPALRRRNSGSGGDATS